MPTWRPHPAVRRAESLERFTVFCDQQYGRIMERLYGTHHGEGREDYEKVRRYSRLGPALFNRREEPRLEMRGRC